jgi:hypothetical protein
MEFTPLSDLKHHGVNAIVWVCYEEVGFFRPCGQRSNTACRHGARRREGVFPMYPIGTIYFDTRLLYVTCQKSACIKHMGLLIVDDSSR